MVKARVNFNDFYYKHRVFGKEVRFVNIPKFPSYVHSRVTRIETKEPETLEWLDTIQAGDILYDIGANIGLYTVAGPRHAQLNRKNVKQLTETTGIKLDLLKFLHSNHTLRIISV